MRYVNRDETGGIIAVFAEPQYNGEEPIAMHDPELLAFVAGNDSESTLQSYLAGTDAELLRIVEDLVNVLIDRNLILLTDFPEGARAKLLKRQAIREKLQNF